jgi:predicted phage-related endonuclease
MQTLDLIQGSPEWKAARANYFTASEAPAMLGLSKYVTRSELLRHKATGIEEDIDPAKQRLFDAGHESEAAARPFVEAFLQEDLFPCTGTLEVNGLPLLASFDGLTMDESIVWENKLSNSHLRDLIVAKELDGTYWPQVEQQLLVSGASRCYFTASDGTKEGTIGFWYESQPARREQLLAGWRQFAADLAAYQHTESAPAAVAAPIADLPALAIQISGRVVASNLGEWKSIVVARIDEISTDLKTDEDFATADKLVKFLDEGEKKIDLVKSQAQSQAADIDAVFRAMDEIKASMRAKRLELDKLVKSKKESIRAEILADVQNRFRTHITTLNQRLGGDYLTTIATGFADAMKGKKTVASLRDAVDTELARQKIAANEVADRIEINRKVMEQLCDPAILFPDFKQVCQKGTEDFANLVASRVTQHKAAEEKRQEAERAKIRAEEEARASARVKAEQEEAERQRRVEEAARVAQAIATPEPTPEPTKAPAVSTVTLADVSVATAKATFKQSRPSDEEIIQVLSLHYRVHESKVIEWLCEIDLSSASERMAEEFAA